MKGSDLMYDDITRQAQIVATELLEEAKMKPGSLLVIGCSSSEIVGKRIGKGSSMEAAGVPWRGEKIKVNSAS